MQFYSQGFLFQNISRNSWILFHVSRITSNVGNMKNYLKLPTQHANGVLINDQRFKKHFSIRNSKIVALEGIIFYDLAIRIFGF